MEDRRRGSFLWRNTAYVLMFCWAVCSQRAFAQVHFTVVAKTGDVAPGLNETFGDVVGPLINNAGEVVFTGKGLSFDAPAGAPMGIYVGAPGNVQLIAKVGDPAPGSGAGASLSNTSPLAFSDNGQVVIGAYLEGPGIARFSDYAYWTGSARQPLAHVAQLNAAAPGFDPPVNYYSLGPQVRLANGRILFHSRLRGDGQTGDAVAALWSGSAGDIHVVARGSTTPPGVNDALYGVFTPALNAAGQIAFSSELVGLDKQYNGQTGLWYGTAASQQLVLRSGQPAPQATGKMIEWVSAPTLNRAGQLAFIANLGTFSGGGEELNDVAIYTGTPGDLQLRARTGQAAPGMPAGVFFGGETVYGHGAQSFNAATQSGQGHIAFSGLVSGPGIDISNNNGLWLGKPGQPLALIAREGAAAPGVPGGGGVFVPDIDDIDQYNPTFYAPSINNRGQVVFVSAYRDDANQIVPGIWGTDVDDTLHMIVRDGQEIDLGGGVMKTLKYFNGAFGFGSASDDGQNFVFNDAGQLVLDAHFTDGTSAVLIANVPEPVGLGMVLVSLAGLACRGRRRQRPT